MSSSLRRLVNAAFHKAAFWVALCAFPFIAGCATRTQEVRRNDPPLAQLQSVLEIRSGGLLGFGAPLAGQDAVTALHVVADPKDIRWATRWEHGRATVRRGDAEADLVWLELDQPVLGTLIPETGRPDVGEELFYPIHMADGSVSWSRGWVLGNQDDLFIVSGWFHPGTSGSPVLRSNGKLLGIATSAANWSCRTNWQLFATLTLEEALACLYRRTTFPPEMVVQRLG